MSNTNFYQGVEQEIHRIMHSADGDTDDLIAELTEWVVERFGAGESAKRWLVGDKREYPDRRPANGEYMGFGHTGSPT